MKKNEKTLFRKDEKGCVWVLEKNQDGSKVWESVALRGGPPQPFRPEDLKRFRVYEIENIDDFHSIDKLVPISLGLKNKLDFGWIDHEGRFWGCDYGGHEFLASKVLEENSCEMEQSRGWIHVESDNWQFYGRAVSPAQEKGLSSIGRLADDPFYRDYSVKFEDVFPNGYPLHHLPGISIHHPDQDLKPQQDARTKTSRKRAPQP